MGNSLGEPPEVNTRQGNALGEPPEGFLCCAVFFFLTVIQLYTTVETFQQLLLYVVFVHEFDLVHVTCAEKPSPYHSFCLFLSHTLSLSFPSHTQVHDVVCCNKGRYTCTTCHPTFTFMEGARRASWSLRQKWKKGRNAHVTCRTKDDAYTIIKLESRVLPIHVYSLDHIV